MLNKLQSSFIWAGGLVSPLDYGKESKFRERKRKCRFCLDTNLSNSFWEKKNEVKRRGGRRWWAMANIHIPHPPIALLSLSLHILLKSISFLSLLLLPITLLSLSKIWRLSFGKKGLCIPNLKVSYLVCHSQLYIPKSWFSLFSVLFVMLVTFICFMYISVWRMHICWFRGKGGS